MSKTTVGGKKTIDVLPKDFTRSNEFEIVGRIGKERSMGLGHKLLFNTPKMITKGLYAGGIAAAAYGATKGIQALTKGKDKPMEKKALLQKIANELTAQGRKHIKKKNFALPGEKKYPINDLVHARNALARVSQHGTPSQQSEVRSKVYAKYPGLKERVMEKKSEYLEQIRDSAMNAELERLAR